MTNLDREAAAIEKDLKKAEKAIGEVYEEYYIKRLAFPKLNDFNDLFEVVKKDYNWAEASGERHRSYYLSCSNFKQYCTCYVKPKQAILDHIKEDMISDCGGIYFELVYHDDDDVLVIAKYQSIIGSRWLASINFKSIPKVAFQEPQPPGYIAPTRTISGALITIEEDVQDILRDHTEITGDGRCVKLTCGQLDPKLYKRVDSVLKMLGGRWHTGKGAHVFPKDITEKLHGVKDSGTVTNHKKALQKFFTPDAVVAEIMDRLDPEPGLRSLEPSAGAGAIAKAMRAAGMSVACMELDPEDCETLRADGFDVQEGDFLKTNPIPKYHRIGMNPPFTKGQDVEHVQWAFRFLKKGGKLVSVMSPAINTNNSMLYKNFREFLKKYNAKVEPLLKGAFAESGTTIETVLVTIQR